MATEEIPVTFTQHGKTYTGYLSQANGSGTNTFPLMVNKRYCGQFNLMLQGWEFFGNTPEWDDEELGRYFEMVVTGWFQ